MQHQIFDIAFLKKFRRANVRLPFDTVSTSRPLFIRQYAGLTNEIPLLLEYLKSTVNQTQAVDSLVRQLKDRSYPSSCSLTSLSRRGTRVFSDFIKKEPRAANYCSRILDILTPLAIFAEELRKNIHQNLEHLDKFSDVSFQLKKKFIGSGSVTAMITITDCYLSELHKYYIDLTGLLYKEAAETGAVRITRQVTPFLTRITKAIKDSIVDVDSALPLFENLELSLAKIERQGIFN